MFIPPVGQCGKSTYAKLAHLDLINKKNYQANFQTQHPLSKDPVSQKKRVRNQNAYFCIKHQKQTLQQANKDHHTRWTRRGKRAATWQREEVLQTEN